MPIYMDRHDVSDTVTAKNVAELHQQDLKIQHKFDCRGLTYWFDEKRKTAFCLVEAPDAESIRAMHAQAHGQIPHSIIEVDGNIVESFLGRIENPKKRQDQKLNIINDPAFRTIMVLKAQRSFITKKESFPAISSLSGVVDSIIENLTNHNGSIVKQTNDTFLVSFDSVSGAVACALSIQSVFNEIAKAWDQRSVSLKIGLSAGSPVTGKEGLFADTIKQAERMCSFIQGQIVISSEVKELYQSENLNSFLHDDFIVALTPPEEAFFSHLMNYIEQIWADTTINVNDLYTRLGYSKSNLYRRMIALTGKSPNTFIMEYRLAEALKLLNRQEGNISEIAFATGFNSISYFSKCFRKRYGESPSAYLRQIAA